MANDKHVALLKKGVAAWNEWRAKNPDIRPDLREANFSKADLSRADLSLANLSGADLSRADLSCHVMVAVAPATGALSAILSQADEGGQDKKQ